MGLLFGFSSLSRYLYLLCHVPPGDSQLFECHKKYSRARDPAASSRGRQVGKLSPYFIFIATENRPRAGSHTQLMHAAQQHHLPSGSEPNILTHRKTKPGNAYFSSKIIF